MTAYRMDDGTVVKTDSATETWEEAKRFDGHNQISVATGSEWTHETLYRSRKGRYWIEHTTQRQGFADYAEWVGNRAAAQWLLHNGYRLPDDLADLEAEVSE